MNPVILLIGGWLFVAMFVRDTERGNPFMAAGLSMFIMSIAVQVKKEPRVSK